MFLADQRLVKVPVKNVSADSRLILFLERSVLFDGSELPDLQRVAPILSASVIEAQIDNRDRIPVACAVECDLVEFSGFHLLL